MNVTNHSMNGIDVLLHKAVLQSIQNQIDGEKFQHIEQGLQEQGIKLSDLVSRSSRAMNPSWFEEEIKKIEDSVLKEFLVLEGNPHSTWITIKNRYLTELILKTFADDDKKRILDFVRNRPETIPKTLASCNLPNTSGYRKMRQLIDDGFVMTTGLVESFEGRRTLVYKSVIHKIQITINKNEIYARISVPKEIIGSSDMIKTIVDVGQGKRIVAN